MTSETQCCDNVVTTLCDVATKVQPKPNVATTSSASWEDTFNSTTKFHYIICDKTLKCDPKLAENLNIIDNILLSKCWGIKAVFHSVNFCLWRSLCWSYRKNFCDNIETTLGKTFMWKCDINFFEITLLLHRGLLGNLSFIFWGCSWYWFVVIIIFIRFIVESVISTFLKSHFLLIRLLIDVFLGISHLFSGIVPGIHFFVMMIFSRFIVIDLFQ